MRKAFIVRESAPYAQIVYLVFADTEKEAKTTLYNSEISLHGSDREIVMEVQATFNEEWVIELGGYRE